MATENVAEVECAHCGEQVRIGGEGGTGPRVCPSCGEPVVVEPESAEDKLATKQTVRFKRLRPPAR